MSSDFLRAINFCEAVIDGTHDSPKQVEDGRKLVTSKNVVGGKLDLENCYNISQEDFEQINKRSKVYQWDILMSMIGTVGEICILKDEPDYAIKNVGVFRAKNESDAKWLYYYLISPNAQFEIYSRLRGSTQKFLPLGELRNFPILKPANEERKSSIINQLFSIDCLISSNERLNDKVSELIWAFFRSWFIDFDPVKAKAEGKLPYGMDEETAALFPDSFKDSELGSIPTGWKIVTISDICDLVSRGVTPDYEDGTGRWIINQKVNYGVNLNLENLKELSKSCIVPEGKFAKRFDVLVNCLGEGTLGRIHFFNGDSNYYAVDQHMSICRAKSSSVGLYIYHTLSSPTGQWRIDSVKTGSTGMTMFNISKLRAFKIYIPPQRILDKFWDRASDLIHLSRSCVETRNRLAHTRDALLPRLMSGEL